MTTTFDASRALRAGGLLATFNHAGILSAADVHVASRLGAIGAESDEAVLLAVALVTRSTRLRCARTRHGSGHDQPRRRLPFEIVVIDEASMVSLTLMARLFEALRPSTRLVILGDPDQLASVEAGAVLGDLVDRTDLGLRTPAFAEALHTVLPKIIVQRQSSNSPASQVRDGVAILTTNWRFPADSGIAELAAAIQAGQGEKALEDLQSGKPDVESSRSTRTRTCRRISSPACEPRFRNAVWLCAMRLARVTTSLRLKPSSATVFCALTDGDLEECSTGARSQSAGSRRRTPWCRVLTADTPASHCW